MVLKGCFQFKYKILELTVLYWSKMELPLNLMKTRNKRNRNAYTFFVQEQWAEINKTRTTKMTQSLFGKISKVSECPTKSSFNLDGQKYRYRDKEFGTKPLIFNHLK